MDGATIAALRCKKVQLYYIINDSLCTLQKIAFPNHLNFSLAPYTFWLVYTNNVIHFVKGDCLTQKQLKFSAFISEGVVTFMYCIITTSILSPPLSNFFHNTSSTLAKHKADTPRSSIPTVMQHTSPSSWSHNNYLIIFFYYTYFTAPLPH